MSYNNILVSVDLTDEADEVLAAARNTSAAQAAAKVSVVNVIRPLARTYGGLDMANVVAGAPFEEELRQQSREKLSELASEYGVNSNDVYVKLGTPAFEIRSLAQELGADLIVIGTHGRHGLGLLLGSTANAVLHGVGCDVLVVRVHPASADT